MKVFPERDGNMRSGSQIDGNCSRVRIEVFPERDGNASGRFCGRELGLGPVRIEVFPERDGNSYTPSGIQHVFSYRPNRGLP